jgi:hypothetical protein
MNNSFATGKLRGPFKHVLPFSCRLAIAISGGRKNPLPVFTRVLNEALRHAEISSVVDEDVRRFSVR